jgi:hypothetical protein
VTVLGVEEHVVVCYALVLGFAVLTLDHVRLHYQDFEKKRRRK